MGENTRSLKLNKAEMKAGSIELRDSGSQAQVVDMVCIAISLLNIFGIVSEESADGETWEIN
jgi:hypothetical protein